MDIERHVYMDHSATTAVSKAVLDEMMPFFSEYYGNASSIYKLGRQSRLAVEEARDKVAAALGAQSSEIYFTGSGTESDNWFIRGIGHLNKDKGRHIITSSIEHPAVLETCADLEKEGFEVTYLAVDEYGMVSADAVASAIRQDTVLVTIMTANNEVGTIQPISEIGSVCREKSVLFHTDAVQAVGNMRIDVIEMNVDAMSISGHKFYGPKGIGALYVRKGIRLPAFITGGHQEKGKRAGTENVPAIVGMGKAIELANDNLQGTIERLTRLRDQFISMIENRIPHIKLNGHRTQRLPGHVNFSFHYIEGESLLLMLDMQGIAASSGSACTSGSLDPSHVLLAIGLPHEIAHGSLRLTLGKENTEEEIEYTVDRLQDIVARLRTMSPLYEGVED